MDLGHYILVIDFHLTRVLAGHLTYRPIQLGDYLLRPGDLIDHLFFPADSINSLVGDTGDGRSAEIGIIGNEGAVGIDRLLGMERSINSAVIQLSLKLNGRDVFSELVWADGVQD